MTAKAPHRRRVDEIIAALTGGLSIRKAAIELGLSESTVKRVSTENRAVIDAARSEQARRVVEELRDRALYAARRLEELMDSKNDAVAISACRAALSEALRWGEQAELTDRLTALEARAGLRAV